MKELLEQCFAECERQSGGSFMFSATQRWLVDNLAAKLLAKGVQLPAEPVDEEAVFKSMIYRHFQPYVVVRMLHDRGYQLTRIPK